MTDSDDCGTCGIDVGEECDFMCERCGHALCEDCSDDICENCHEEDRQERIDIAEEKLFDAWNDTY